VNTVCVYTGFPCQSASVSHCRLREKAAQAGLGSGKADTAASVWLRDRQTETGLISPPLHTVSSRSGCNLNMALVDFVYQLVKVWGMKWDVRQIL
jgi:hypothetical protein